MENGTSSRLVTYERWEVGERFRILVGEYCSLSATSPEARLRPTGGISRASRVWDAGIQSPGRLWWCS